MNDCINVEFFLAYCNKSEYLTNIMHLPSGGFHGGPGGHGHSTTTINACTTLAASGVTQYRPP